VGAGREEAREGKGQFRGMAGERLEGKGERKGSRICSRSKGGIEAKKRGGKNKVITVIKKKRSCRREEGMCG